MKWAPALAPLACHSLVQPLFATAATVPAQTPYAHTGTNLLAVQIDAAINSGKQALVQTRAQPDAPARPCVARCCSAHCPTAPLKLPQAHTCCSGNSGGPALKDGKVVGVAFQDLEVRWARWACWARRRQGAFLVPRCHYRVSTRSTAGMR